MRKPGARSQFYWPVLLTVLLTGCLGGRSSLTGTHRLLPSTEALEQPVPVAFPRELDKHVLPPYIVEPGDVLLVQPADLDSPVRLPGDQPILPDGTINLGRYGHILVAGKTVDEIAGLIKATVEPQAKDVGIINVRLVTRASKVYYVLGEVNAPGAFPISGRETVLDAIIAAGGLTERAAHKKVILSRPTAPDSCRIVLPVCYNEIVQHGDTTSNYQLAPGDRIYVASKAAWEDWFSHDHDKKSCVTCSTPTGPCPLPPLHLGGTGETVCRPTAFASPQ
jgi:protein involved in polysaccharide export with SLBB domain